MDRLRNLDGERGMTLITVTHNLRLAEQAVSSCISPTVGWSHER